MPGSHPAFIFCLTNLTLPHHWPKEDTVHKQLTGAVSVGAEVGLILKHGLFKK
jgi:hypothetical protein